MDGCENGPKMMVSEASLEAGTFLEQTLEHLYLGIMRLLQIQQGNRTCAEIFFSPCDCPSDAFTYSFVIRIRRRKTFAL